MKNSTHTQLVRLSCFLVLGFALGACTSQKLDKKGVNNIALIQKTQRVIRTNCSGNVVSEQVEVVNKPEQWVTVAPETGYQPVDARFYSNTTADSADLISANTTFLVQYQKRDWGMSVMEGSNSVHYQFYACPDKTRKDCKSDTYQSVEEGDLNLAVSYSEEFIGGVSNISAVNCPTPTPHL